MPEAGDRPRLTKARASKQKTASPAPSGPGAREDWPGLNYRLRFAGGRKQAVTLSRCACPALAEQASRIIWDDHQDGVVTSASTAHGLCGAAVRFAEFLAERHPSGVDAHLGSLSEKDVEDFETWIHAKYEDPLSGAPDEHMSFLIRLIARAMDRGLIPPALRERCRYISARRVKPATNLRDAYDEFTMSKLREAAKADASTIIARLAEGRRLAQLGADPRTDPQGWRDPLNVLWHYVNLGLPKTTVLDEITAFFRNKDFTATRLLEYAFPSIVDFVPFLVLLADANGLPIECNHELAADCLDEDKPASGSTYLSYVKRRRHKDGRVYKERVDVVREFSTGWLVLAMREFTAAIRKHCGHEEGRGPLVLARADRTLGTTRVHHYAIQAWLRDNPVALVDGVQLEQLLLSRIRKSSKANAFLEGGGNLKRIGKDHSKRVFLDRYVRIPLLEGHFEAAAADAIELALKNATRIRTLDEAAKADATLDAAGVAAKLDVSEEQLRGLASGGSDVITSACLDIKASPFSPQGTLCGAPLYGCLDCANAVFTSSRLPQLLQLLDHVVQQRGAMNIDDWRSHYGFAYARTMQIVDAFPHDEVAAAMAEVEEGGGRDWTIAQIAYGSLA